MASHAGHTAHTAHASHTAGTLHPRADAQRNRAALLAAAADVLAVAPQASLAEVATRAGLGRATLYRHFDTREGLRDAIRDEALTCAHQSLGAVDLEGCDIREGLRRAADALVPLGMRFRILLAEGTEEDADFTVARDAILAPLWELVARGVESGEVSAQAPPGWADIVLAGLLMSAVRATAAGVVDAGTASELVAVTFVDGFGAD